MGGAPSVDVFDEGGRLSDRACDVSSLGVDAVVDGSRTFDARPSTLKFWAAEGMREVSQNFPRQPTGSLYAGRVVCMPSSARVSHMLRCPRLRVQGHAYIIGHACIALAAPEQIARRPCSCRKGGLIPKPIRSKSS